MSLRTLACALAAGTVASLFAVPTGSAHAQNVLMKSCPITPEEGTFLWENLTKPRNRAPNSEGVRIRNNWKPIRATFTQNADGFELAGDLEATFQFVNSRDFGEFVGGEFRREANVTYKYDAREGMLTIIAVDERNAGPLVFDLKAREVVGINTAESQAASGSISAGSVPMPPAVPMRPAPTAPLTPPTIPSMPSLPGMMPGPFTVAPTTNGGLLPPGVMLKLPGAGMKPPANAMPQPMPSFGLGISESFAAQRRTIATVAIGLPADLELIVDCQKIAEGRSVQRVGYRFRSEFSLTLDVTVVQTDTAQRKAKASLFNFTGKSFSFGESEEKIFMLSKSAFAGNVAVGASGAGLDSLLLTDKNRGALMQSFGGSFQIFFQVDGTPLQNFRTKNDPEVL